MCTWIAENSRTYPDGHLVLRLIFYSGALKSNIGHLEGASGVAGLIKTILVLERAWIPPNANFQHLNPDIDAGNLNLRVCLPSNQCIAFTNRSLVSY